MNKLVVKGDGSEKDACVDCIRVDQGHLPFPQRESTLLSVWDCFMQMWHKTFMKVYTR
jgi:hypothetical protein